MSRSCKKCDWPQQSILTKRQTQELLRPRSHPRERGLRCWGKKKALPRAIANNSCMRPTMRNMGSRHLSMRTTGRLGWLCPCSSVRSQKACMVGLVTTGDYCKGDAGEKIESHPHRAFGPFQWSALSCSNALSPYVCRKGASSLNID